MGRNKVKEVLINSIRGAGKDRLEPYMKKRHNVAMKNVTVGCMHFDAYSQKEERRKEEAQGTFQMTVGQLI